MNLKGKKLRSQKRKGSRGQISTQDFDCQFITRDCESEIITDGQNITDDCESEIITDDCEGEIIAQGCEGEGHILRHSFDCLNEDGILCSILSSLPLKEAVANLPQCSASFIHLKRLDWDCPKWSLGVKMNLPHLDMLLNAAPFLEELKLRLTTCGVEEAPPRVTKLKQKLTGHPRPHLKSVEISGFHFERGQVQIVLYLLKSAIGLESMTLEKGQEISETDMNSLIQQVSPNVKLIIL